MRQPWWKKAVVYQIYPKSFNDTTGNGIGDLQGIIEKLDYLQQLGVDVLWLTPIYQSPQHDNGYDISDYYTIFNAYGTMDDFEQLLMEVHQRNMKLIMDIVVNHTSIEHEWFKEAKLSKDNPYRNFYIWKDGKNGQAPTNWKSKFGGSAWQYDAISDQYYLHLFDKTQADLNWENEKVRDALYEMMDFWLEKGVDGFRLDVINLLSKDQDFPDDDGSISPGDGRKFYTDGPKIHTFLHDMNKRVFRKYDMMTVGEMSSTSIENCIKYTCPDREELDMTFNFHHLKVDYPNGEKWTNAPFNFHQLKQILSEWQVKMYQGGGWNALFWCNHDQPRVVSRFGNDAIYHEESAKMLATTIHMMQGTPYIYQGEEFGMTNPGFDQIEDYRDVETLNMYQIKLEEGVSKQQIMDILKQKSRDNSRTPVQWNNKKNAGFSPSDHPWIPVAANYCTINAEAALKDANSIFYHYQKLIRLRKTYDVITNGDYQLILPDHHAIFAYIRNNGNEKIVVLNNFYEGEANYVLPDSMELDKWDTSILLSNYKDSNSLEQKKGKLRPYESIVYYLKK
ncbi:alpha,alpha-phosphotrehalase [Paraliobacillus sp. JSM ZJ581]|uniref:alpha,alpha-phosphotrehalase n=1 Tax=Paraliobacillus sp. JSM ZJ581 TaxID=3342118 RepID=UPI0035A912A7